LISEFEYFYQTEERYKVFQAVVRYRLGWDELNVLVVVVGVRAAGLDFAGTGGDVVRCGTHSNLPLMPSCGLGTDPDFLDLQIR
jgi:hypothetical protein